ncbi:hypothetical protein C7974DRAFT_472857 [Boeremia exigua]|uniref:uncharacterized protein n=1 Tax=Boeremia exigua TaxID=749465 RepID=UPI001E8EDF75|nr:uncharacterized protein C7974DRAFT_472857 [Boeremia exigua]KAH6625500.1 hypothetical protein C7974DRAFT_472857 [Boeremia exigua]
MQMSGGYTNQMTIFQQKMNRLPERHRSATTDAKPLGEPLKFKLSGKTAQNLFLKAAMTEQLSSWDTKDLPARGIQLDRMAKMYRKWGVGSYRVSLTGNIFLWRLVRGFQKIVTEAKRHGSLIIGQTCHPGRQCDNSVQPDPVSVSDVQMTVM